MILIVAFPGECPKDLVNRASDAGADLAIVRGVPNTTVLYPLSPEAVRILDPQNWLRELYSEIRGLAYLCYLDPDAVIEKLSELPEGFSIG